MRKVSEDFLPSKSSFFVSRRFPFWLPVLLIAAVIPSAVEWYRHAPTYLTYQESSYAEHWPHAQLLFVHIAGATVPLFVGPWMLWSGLRQRYMNLHRWLGRTYLILGTLGVSGGMLISVLSPHDPQSLFIATFTLGSVWFGAAFMAYRAIRNYQVDQHREWMIRSYVLTFTFVNCRLAGELPLFGWLGLESITALVWLGWTVPLFLTEMAIQWKKGSAIN